MEISLGIAHALVDRAIQERAVLVALAEIIIFT